MKEYLAHISEHDKREQTVEQHLFGTAALAERFAKEFNAAGYGRLVGMAHDIGKYSDAFQKRLHGGPKVDHSIAGALECAEIDQLLAGVCVAGHHGGLPDFGNTQTDMTGDSTFVGRIRGALPERGEAYPGWNGRLPETPAQPDFGDDLSMSFWTRMLFSSLVDADFLDTEAFMKNGSRNVCYDEIPTLLTKLDMYVSRWDVSETDLDATRNRIRADCTEASESEKGIFSLTVPTGGGKTGASLAFALNHAKKHGMKRIIYVIPYTSIIEQNAGVFRKILGDGNVLEHHFESEFLYSEDLTDDQKSISLASENWDAPVIVTTAVQFFESMYSNKPSKCRKLHNIANSVIIFDEAQMLPIAQLRPCVAAIGTLVKSFGCTAVLCTATQPFISDMLSEYAPDITVREICKDAGEVFEKLARVTYNNAGKITTEEVARALSEERQVLCIVNTRKTARDLFFMLESDGSYHLSTYMYPEHRKATLAEIRRRLSEGLPCRVVSTSLIEAGVDVDFPCVYRERSGLDSMVQAAGRCNREGKRRADESMVHIFETDGRAPATMRINIGAAREAMNKYSDLGGTEAVDAYFKSLRSLIGNENLDSTNAVKYLSKGVSGCRLPFRTVAEAFRLIDDTTRTVYCIPEDDKRIINEIMSGTANRETYRKAGRYGVNVCQGCYDGLLQAGDIKELPNGAAYLVNESLYNENTGLVPTAEFGNAEFI